MDWLRPKLRRQELATLAACAFLGALVAGIYGVIHDQITYTLSPVYFTRYKFHQFESADFGFSDRVFVAEVGFLGTWWVGLLAGWVLGRLTVARCGPQRAVCSVLAGFGWIIACAVAGALVGELWFRLHPETPAAWIDLCETNGIDDVLGFTRVGWIHLAGYAGAAAGSCLAGFLQWRKGPARR